MQSTQTMADVVTIGVGGPEQGWPPFGEWLREQGLDWHQVRTVTIDQATLEASAVVFKLRGGKPYAVDDEVATKTVTFRAKTAPPCYIDHLAKLAEAKQARS
jgi:hypothetical protein